MAVARGLRETHQAFGLGIGQLAEQHRFHCAEHRRIHPDAERQNCNGRQSEARRMAQHAKSVAGVLPKLLAGVPTPCFAASLLQSSDVSKAAPGFFSCLCFVLAICHKGPDLFFNMVRHFGGKICRDVPFPNKSAQCVHDSVGLIMRRIPVSSRSNPVVS